MCDRQHVSEGPLHTWGVAESSDLFSDAKNLLNDAQVAYQWIELLFLCLLICLALQLCSRFKNSAETCRVHRLIARLRLEGTLKISQFQPLPQTGLPTTRSIASGPIQPGLECPQG